MTEVGDFDSELAVEVMLTMRTFSGNSRLSPQTLAYLFGCILSGASVTDKDVVQIMREAIEVRSNLNPKKRLGIK